MARMQEYLHLVDSKALACDEQSDNDTQIIGSIGCIDRTPEHYRRSAHDRPGIVSSQLLSTILHRGKALAIVCLPSFIQSRFFGKQFDTRTCPTSYLDGIRGLASFIVWHYHYQFGLHKNHKYGWGLNESNRFAIQLPIIRLVHSGGAMIFIFFVISGYVLSMKLLEDARKADMAAFHKRLVSSILKRGPRLFLPLYALTFMVFLGVRLQLFEDVRALLLDKNQFPGNPVGTPDLEVSVVSQLSSWFRSSILFSLFSGHRCLYAPQAWTLLLEFRSSMFLFLYLAAFSRTSHRNRMIGTSLGILLGFYTYTFDMPLYLAGQLIAEMNAVSRSIPISNTRLTSFSRFSRMRSWCAHSDLFWAFNLLPALFLLSEPNSRWNETPGWITLGHLIPGGVIWPQIGAMWFIWSVSNCAFLQVPFRTTMLQYLGKISYSLYITHWAVGRNIGYILIPPIMRVVGNKPGLQWELSCLIGFFMSCIPVIWFADVFWQRIEMPSANLITRLEKIL